MQNPRKIILLHGLFELNLGNPVRETHRLPRTGSHREYYRLTGQTGRCIGVYSPDPLETRAFLEFTRHFRRMGLHVPELIAEDEAEGIYLLQDLGNQTLKEEVDSARAAGTFPGQILPLYRSALDHLLDFQIRGHDGLDYSLCVPRASFDRQSVMWDLNHFKYLFLKVLGISFDEQKLEDDFHRLAASLSKVPGEFFLYRDFQSRNILLHEKELYFVDYQGGRRGPLQYDPASLLFESKIDLGPHLREELLEYYLEKLNAMTGRDPGEFMGTYYSFVLIRILQVLGAYGIRGIVENKSLFLQSIPFAVKNIRWLNQKSLIPGDLHEISACLQRICEMEEWELPDHAGELTVRIQSFSYQKGIPRDLSGNGGGFVFDCRALPNPGREEQYRNFTGLDEPVIHYLKEKEEVGQFMERSFQLVRQSIEAYRERGFDHLMVSFGCTGGQHRSVYCAERLQELINKNLKVKTILAHRELKI
jgi:aminoglycoside/choline kinase family phosphotransferase